MILDNLVRAFVVTAYVYVFWHMVLVGIAYMATLGNADLERVFWIQLASSAKRMILALILVAVVREVHP